MATRTVVKDSEIAFNTTVSIIGAAGTVSSFASKASGTLAPFLPLISSIFALSKEIIDLYENAHHNRRTCGFLLQRAALAKTAVEIFVARANEFKSQCKSKEFLDNFEGLVAVVERIRDFVKEFSQFSLFKKMLRANDIKDKFKELTEEFDGRISILNFSISVQSHCEMDAIQNDIKDLKTYLENIHEDRLAVGKEAFDEINMTYKKYREQTLGLNDVEAKVMISAKQIQQLNGDKRGEYCKAYRTSNGTKEVVALKRWRPEFKEASPTLPAAPKDDEKFKRDLMIRTFIYQQMKFAKNIVAFHGLVKKEGVITKEVEYFLVTEWPEYGTLVEAYTNNPDAFTWKVKAEIAVDVIRGLTFLHSVSIFHHQISSTNVIITRGYTAKITNFEYSRDQNDVISIPMNETLQYLRYLAPEKTSKPGTQPRYNEKCEIYSLGILLWEIGECKLPFSEYNDPMELSELLQKGNITLTFRQDTPPKWEKATLEAAHYIPTMRPMLSQLFTTFFDICENIKFADPPASMLVSNEVDVAMINEMNAATSIWTVEEAIAEHKLRDRGDRRKAFQVFKTHAEAGDALAKYYYGYYLYHYRYDRESGTSDTPEEEKERFKKAAMAFNEASDEIPEAQGRYGACLLDGVGVEQNQKEAIEYLQKAAKRNSSTGLFLLGKLHYLGARGVAKDVNMGTLYLRKAVKVGNGTARTFCEANNIPLVPL